MRFLVLFAAVIFLGCASLEEAAQKRAAFDLDCPQNKISVSEIGNNSYGAIGCDQRVSYYCWRDAFGGRRCLKDSETLKKMHVDPVAPPPTVPPG